MSTTTHPAIDRLAAIGSEELSIAQVAEEVLFKSRALIHSLINDGQLEALKERARSGKKKGAPEPTARGPRHTYTITAAAVLVYLVKSTQGDKAVILSAIAQRFPHHAHLFTPPAPAPLPANVLPFKRPAKPRTEAAPATQLELFA